MFLGSSEQARHALVHATCGNLHLDDGADMAVEEGDSPVARRAGRTRNQARSPSTAGSSMRFAQRRAHSGCRAKRLMPEEAMARLCPASISRFYRGVVGLDAHLAYRSKQRVQAVA